MFGPKPRNYNGRSRPNGPRGAVLGNGPQAVPPAWKAQPKTNAPLYQGGSKVFISGLPLDVEKDAIVELMENTIGPLNDTFCVYNKAGKFTGMAVVHFARPPDAIRAVTLYNNKIIDQRKPIKVEVIGELPPLVPFMNAPAAPPPPPQRSLLTRLQGLNQTLSKPPRPQPQPAAPVQSNGAEQPRRRRKKGPKRLQKVTQAAPRKKTAEELDREMEDYMRKRPASTSKNE